jgi:hypothetical protein
MAMSEQASVGFDREKWREEYELRKREIEIKERESNRNRWSSPLVLALLTAAVAGLGNAVAIVLNGREPRDLEITKSDQAKIVEETKAEAARIFEIIRTGNPVQAATNLKFLVDVDLIRDAGRIRSIKALDLGDIGKLPALPLPVIGPPVDVNEPPPLPLQKGSNASRKSRSQATAKRVPKNEDEDLVDVTVPTPAQSSPAASREPR